MKKFYGILFLLALMAFKTNLHAQTCAGVTAEAIPINPQTGSQNNFTVRVTLSQIYGQDVTVSGYFYDEGVGANLNSPFTLTVTAGNLTAETYDHYSAHPTSSGAVVIESVTPCPPGGTQDVSVNGNHLKFISLAVYEQYANNELDRSLLTNLATANSGVTTLEEINNAQDTLYPEFLKQILNTDEIVEAGSFLIKVDLENNRALIISSSDPNAYQILSNNQLTANGLMNFSDNVGNTIEILQAIESGQLSIANYQSSIEMEETAKLNRNSLNIESESLASITLNEKRIQGGPSENEAGIQQAPTSCRHASRKTDKDQYPIIWKTVLNQNSGCPDNIMKYGMDNKVVYQNFIIYFSLQSKINSKRNGTCQEPHWTFGPTTTADLMLTGSVRYSKRCGSEQSYTITDGNTGTVLNWRPYESSRSLSKYEMTVEFGIRDAGSSNNFFTGLRTYHIIDGY